MSKDRRGPGRRKSDKVISTLRKLTLWSLGAISAVLVVWNAAIGAGTQFAEDWQRLKQAFTTQPIGKK